MKTFCEADAAATVSYQLEANTATTVAWQPPGGYQPTDLNGLIRKFVDNLVPYLVNPQNPQITQAQLESVVVMFRNQLQDSIMNYNPYNNLSTAISNLFQAGRRGTTRPPITPT